MRVIEENYGYYGIGIMQHKRDFNIGTLWRSAYILGASYIFTIGKSYKKQTSDVLKTWSRIPLFHYDTFEEFKKAIPYDCQLIGIELDKRASPLHEFEHPKRAVYLLGAEDNGLPTMALDSCQHLVQLPGNYSLNVAVTGSIVLNDRVVKMPSKLPTR
ncbi:RNA methyltransferase [Crocinitomicaceae bacterium]|nr:RNA methyltransferase [Crocinitomicaceae bacterium]